VRGRDARATAGEDAGGPLAVPVRSAYSAKSARLFFSVGTTMRWISFCGERCPGKYEARRM
jgi:hypothetical protein